MLHRRHFRKIEIRLFVGHKRAGAAEHTYEHIGVAVTVDIRESRNVETAGIDRIDRRKFLKYLLSKFCYRNFRCFL